MQVFFSYTHVDDNHNQGALSRLRELLEQELTLQSGVECEVFQDTGNIEPGQRWQERLREGVADAIFFVPIVTPSYIRSQACRAEINEFASLCDQRGLRDRIVPLLFIDVPALHDVAKVRRSQLLSLINSHQWVDLRDRRFSDISDSSIRTLVATIAQRMVARQTAGRPSKKTRTRSAQSESGGQTAPKTSADLLPENAGAAEAPAGPFGRAEWFPRTGSTLTVDAAGKGDFSSLDHAIHSCPDGTRLRLSPGTYRCEYPIRKSVAIEGTGSDSVVLETVTGACVWADAPAVFLRGLTIKRLRVVSGDDNDEDPEPSNFAVYVTSGRAVISDCQVYSESLSGIGAGGDSKVTVVGCAISDCRQSGIFCYETSEVEVVACDISKNRSSGVTVSDRGRARVLLSRSENNGSDGFTVSDSGRLVVDSCVSRGNTLDGIDFSGEGLLQVRSCRIEGNQRAGVFLHSKAPSVVTIAESHFEDNVEIALSVSAQTNPSIFGNVVNGCREGGSVFVYDTAEGRFSHNVFRGDDVGDYAIVECAGKSRPAFVSNRIQGGRGSGFYARELARPELIFNEISDCARDGVICFGDAVIEGANNQISRNRGYGMRLSDRGSVNLQETEYVSNVRGEIKDDREGSDLGEEDRMDGEV